jgi:hypothetical protein
MDVRVGIDPAQARSWLAIARRDETTGRIRCVRVTVRTGQDAALPELGELLRRLEAQPWR